MPEITIMLDTESHSGSPNLPKLLTECEEFIGEPDICINLAANGAFDFQRLWVLNSCRGYVNFDVQVETIRAEEAYHVSDCGGILPDTFNVFRELID
jgi:hypothetical protein